MNHQAVMLLLLTINRLYKHVPPARIHTLFSLYNTFWN